MRGRDPAGRARGRAAPFLLFVGGLVLLLGCGSADAPRDPDATRPGLTVTGTFDGRTVGVRDRSPELVEGDCDPQTGPDEDVCIVSRTISGDTFVLVVANPVVLEAGVDLDVASSDCAGVTCDGITNHAVVDVQVGSDRRRAAAGRLSVARADRNVRYIGEFTLSLPRGTVSGTFDVVPRDD